MSADILVVDDEQDIRELIADILIDEGYEARVAGNSDEALQQIAMRAPAAIILDIWLQGSQIDGLGILERVKAQHPTIPVVMISGHGSIETAISSIKLGAYDFLEKPFKENRLLLLLSRAIESAKLKQENAQLRERGMYESQIIGDSPMITQLRQIIHRVSGGESRVLIYGDQGSGKEVVARAIHEHSARKHAPFVSVPLSGKTPKLIEQDFFGIESASHATDIKSKVGALENAHGGILFIDEVGDIPPLVQERLLKVLQKGFFVRNGGDSEVPINIRVIAATTRDLQKEISLGRFREDLYYRLNVVPIHVPPLSERIEDIRPLCHYFIKRSATMLGVQPRTISDASYAAMEAYSWPGNVRELRNMIERLLIMEPEDGQDRSIISTAMLPPEVMMETPVGLHPDVNTEIMGLNLRAAREVFERQYLAAQLKRFRGNISKTASFVGMDRSAFHRKLKSLNIQESERVKQEENESCEL